MMPPLLYTLDEDNVARVRLNRPERHNAFDAALISALHETFAGLRAVEGLRAVVLTGEGKSFSAGADLDYMREAGTWGEAENVADGQRLSDMLSAIASCPVPVIAVAKGGVYGGGVGLVACADIAIGVEGATFRLSEVRLGLTPATISPFVIAAIGARQARRLFTTAEPFGVAEALHIGLLHAAVPTVQDADARVAEWIELILHAAPGAVRDAKALVSDYAGRSLDDTVRADSARRIAARRATAEGKEGLAAFLEKRPAAWVKTNA